jgi:hypothetical protein
MCARGAVGAAEGIYWVKKGGLVALFGEGVGGRVKGKEGGVGEGEQGGNNGGTEETERAGEPESEAK